MNIERHYKIIGSLWLVLGGGISVALSVGLFQFILRFGFDITDGASKAFLIGILVSLLTFLSGWTLLKRPIWGRIAIFIVSSTYIAYGALYILFAAPEEEGTVATIITMCLLVLGLYSFFFLLLTRRRK
jgi:hypothetical protein